MKISIVTASRNNCTTIADCLRSIYNQSHPDIEHIVVDGRSTDGTVDVLRDCDNGSIVVSEEPKGVYHALNRGIDLCTGEVVGFLHADDFYPHGEVIADVARTIERMNVDSVYGDLIYVSRDNREQMVRLWRSGHYSSRSLYRGWMPPHPTFFAGRTIYKKHGGFDTSFTIAADYDMLLRLLFKAGITTAYIPEVLVKMRTGGISNRNLRNILLKMAEDARALRKNRVGGAHTVLWKNLRKIPQLLANSYATG